MKETSNVILKKINEVKNKHLIKLNLFESKLTDIPTEVFEMDWLESLDLSFNKITEIPESISKLKNLKSLILLGNKISNISENILMLNDLELLNLDANKFNEIPEIIFKINNLKSLSLRYNQITKISNNISKLVNLKEINLSTNRIKNIPKNIRFLNKLTHLDLSRNEILKLPKEIGELSLLSYINLEHNNIEELPDSFCNLSKLIEVNISYNKLILLPKYIGNLVNLIFLYLDNNHIMALPKDGIINSKNFNEFNISNNLLTELPDSFVISKHLTSLNLKNNLIKKLPINIVELKNLIELDVSENNLEELPISIGELKNLIKLDISENQLRELPISIGELKNLIELDVSENQLQKLPDSIGDLLNIEILCLDNNNILEIPSSIGNLRNNKSLSLYLSNNQLQILPESLYTIINLEALYLDGNQFIKLSENIGHLKELVELNICNNPLQNLPEEIINLYDELVCGFPHSIKTPPYEIAIKGIPTIRKYFEDLIKHGKEFIYEAKLVIVGEPMAGKTSLVRLLLNPDSNLEDYNDLTMTKGIDISKWEFPYIENIKFNARIWDFGGQEIMQSTHRYFLTKRSLYVLVINTREERDIFYYWLQTIQNFTNSSPVMIILNERDDHTIEIPNSILKEYNFIINPIYHVNLKTKRGLFDLSKAIMANLKALPHIGKEEIPKKWIEIKDELESLSLDTISLNSYLKLCNELGSYQELDSRNISQFLHDLGFILHFQNDILLDNTIIKNLKWATKATYEVLMDKEVEKNSGTFGLKDLKNIWKDYNRELFPQLIQLMKNFLICYELNPQEFIIPQLLRTNPPEYKWEYAEVLMFELYYHDYMPRDMLSKFIVKMNKYVYKNIQWRYGVLLQYNNTIAEIIELYERKKITLRFAGEEKSHLLAIVKKEFNELHRLFQELKVEEHIPCICPECKNTENPIFFSYEVLVKYRAKREKTIKCPKSIEDVNVIELLEGYEERIDHSSNQYPSKSGNMAGDFFENILFKLIKAIYPDATIEQGKTIHKETEKYEYDFIVTSVNTQEIIIIEAKGYHDKSFIKLGSKSEKQTVQWFTRNTFPFAKNNYPNPHSHQIKACYITSGYFEEQAKKELESMNSSKQKSNFLDTFYDRDKLIELLELRGMKKDIDNIKRHYLK